MHLLRPVYKIVPGIFPVPCMATVTWTSAHASFLPHSPLLFPFYHKFSFSVCVECFATLILVWLWATSKFCFGIGSKFCLERQLGLESLAWCRGPVIAFLVGFSPTVPGRYLVWYAWASNYWASVICIFYFM
jgi:hypothetical protein